MQEETINIPRIDQEKTVRSISSFIDEKMNESQTSGVVISALVEDWTRQQQHIYVLKPLKMIIYWEL